MKEVYKHYKGNFLGIAIHTETNEEMVVYKALYSKEQLFVRPKKMFEEKIKVNGELTPRFLQV